MESLQYTIMLFGGLQMLSVLSDSVVRWILQRRRREWQTSAGAVHPGSTGTW